MRAIQGLSAWGEQGQVVTLLPGQVGAIDWELAQSMVAAGQGGLVWDNDKLTVYLKDPRAMVKGTKMAFAGLKDDADIANVIAYLDQFK